MASHPRPWPPGRAAAAAGTDSSNFRYQLRVRVTRASQLKTCDHATASDWRQLKLRNYKYAAAAAAQPELARLRVTGRLSPQPSPGHGREAAASATVPQCRGRPRCQPECRRPPWRVRARRPGPGTGSPTPPGLGAPVAAASPWRLAAGGSSLQLEVSCRRPGPGPGVRRLSLSHGVRLTTPGPGWHESLAPLAARGVGRSPPGGRCHRRHGDVPVTVGRVIVTLLARRPRRTVTCHVTVTAAAQ